MFYRFQVHPTTLFSGDIRFQQSIDRLIEHIVVRPVDKANGFFNTNLDMLFGILNR